MTPNINEPAEREAIPKLWQGNAIFEHGWLARARIAAEREAAKDEALLRAADFLAELYAKYQIKIGPFATQAQKIQTACSAALAPEKGK